MENLLIGFEAIKTFFGGISEVEVMKQITTMKKVGLDVKKVGGVWQVPIAEAERFANPNPPKKLKAPKPSPKKKKPGRPKSKPSKWSVTSYE